LNSWHSGGNIFEAHDVPPGRLWRDNLLVRKYPMKLGGVAPCDRAVTPRPMIEPVGVETISVGKHKESGRSVSRTQSDADGHGGVATAHEQTVFVREG
jgi:hypothetical protein